MRRLYGVAIVVAIGVAIAALVSGLIILEGWDAISEESGVAIKQKQHNGISQNSASNVQQNKP